MIKQCERGIGSLLQNESHEQGHIVVCSFKECSYTVICVVQGQVTFPKSISKPDVGVKTDDRKYTHLREKIGLTSQKLRQKQYKTERDQGTLLINKKKL